MINQKTKHRGRRTLLTKAAIITLLATPAACNHSIKQELDNLETRAETSLALRDSLANNPPTFYTPQAEQDFHEKLIALSRKIDGEAQTIKNWQEDPQKFGSPYVRKTRENIDSKLRDISWNLAAWTRNLREDTQPWYALDSLMNVLENIPLPTWTARVQEEALTRTGPEEQTRYIERQLSAREEARTQATLFDRLEGQIDPRRREEVTEAIRPFREHVKEQDYEGALRAAEQAEETLFTLNQEQERISTYMRDAEEQADTIRAHTNDRLALKNLDHALTIMNEGFRRLDYDAVEQGKTELDNLHRSLRQSWTERITDVRQGYGETVRDTVFEGYIAGGPGCRNCMDYWAIIHDTIGARLAALEEERNCTAKCFSDDDGIVLEEKRVWEMHPVTYKRVIKGVSIH